MNKPAQSTSFIGRQSEVAECLRLLESISLLTLSGSGGCGKTRLALHVARISAPHFRDGVWLVELAPLSDASMVVGAVAEALGIAETRSRSLQRSAMRFGRSRLCSCSTTASMC